MKPIETIKFSSNSSDFEAFLFTIAHTHLGQEEVQIPALSQENPHHYYFKVFGRPDVLEISPLSSLDSAIRTTASFNAQSIASLPSFALVEDKKSFIPILNEAIAPALVLLKVTDVLLLHNIPNFVFHVSRKLSSKFSDSLALIGFGHFELMLWTNLDTVDPIFTIVQSLREMTIGDIFSLDSKTDRLPLFTSTLTLPLISYSQVLNSQSWEKLQGNVTPHVKIKCPPGHEDAVISTWPKQWSQSLGPDDLEYYFVEGMPFGEFVKQLISFRKNLSDVSNATDTITEFTKPEEYKPKQIDFQINLQKGKFKLFDSDKFHDCLSMEECNKVIIHEIIGALSYFEESVTGAGSNVHYHDIIHSLGYLRGLITSYQSRLIAKDMPALAEIESRVLDYLQCFDSAMTQYMQTPESILLPRGWERPTFQHSLPHSLRAASAIPEFLFRAIRASSPPQRLKTAVEHAASSVLSTSIHDFLEFWKGFLVTELTQGYKIVNDAEVLYMPYKDLFSPANWITLSHEVSHGYFIRISFIDLEEEYLKTISGHIEAYYGQPTYEIYKGSLDVFYGELFAHWFDYRHFFNGDIDFYIWSIWRTYCSVPRVHKYKTEYWLRTLFVKICADYPLIKTELLEAAKLHPNDRSEKLQQLFKPRLDSIVSFVSRYFPNYSPNINLSEQEKNIITERITMYIDFFRFVEDYYLNADLIRNIEAKPDHFDEALSFVLSGKSADRGIENPFLLLREILRNMKQMNVVKLDDNITLALTFTLLNSARRFVR